jgi:surfactin family lipopeptide synthetase A
MDKAHVEYWTEKLSADFPSLNLAIKRHKSLPQRNNFKSLDLELPAKLISFLEDVAGNENCSLFDILLTALNILLYRYTKQTDILIGVPRFNFYQIGDNELNDIKSDILIVRVDLSGNPSLQNLLSRIKHELKEVSKHRNIKLNRIVAELMQANSDIKSIPILFSLCTETVYPNMPDVFIYTNDKDLILYQYDIVFKLNINSNRISGVILFDTDQFEDHAIHRMSGHYATLLSAIPSSSHLAISQLPIITKSEKRQILDEWNNTLTEFPCDQVIHQIFEAQVERTPDSVAYVIEDQHITYKELNSRANQIARYLIKNGVGPEVLVGICLERSIEMMICIMAVLKAGGAYVPLEPANPLSRNNRILKETNPPLLLTQRNIDRFNYFYGNKIYLDEQNKLFDAEASYNAPCRSRPENLLNIVFTSASTGIPKGAKISIKAVLNRLFWMWKEYPFREEDVTAFHKSYALVAATWEYLGGLLKGIPTIIFSREEILNTNLLWKKLVRHSITHFLATPALLQGVLEQAESHPGEWNTLRLATTSAEPISPRLANRWLKAFPGVPLLNLYGSTECSSNVTVYDVRELSKDASRVPIGKPFANNQVYILDDDLNLQPIGIEGEMCVSGVCLAKGYLNLPELEATSFINNPFSELNDSRLYRTGDIARYLSDGNIELIGRMDNQVKIRGFRVELEDVEVTLSQHEAIKKCAVSVYEDPVIGNCLVAYIVLEKNTTPHLLRLFLRDRLPGYMIPTYFTRIESMPLTTTGKIDRKQLPLPDESWGKDNSIQVAPRNDLEQIICEILQKILQVDQISVHDYFLDMGLHSLLMVRFMNHLNSKLNRDIPILTLLQHSSVRDLAKHLSSYQDTDILFTDTGIHRAKQRLTMRYKRRMRRLRKGN